MKIQLAPLQSSLSLFDGGGGGHGHVPPKYSGLHGHFKRSPSTNSNLSLAANFKMPSSVGGLGGLGNIVFSKRSSMTSLRSPAAETAPEVASSSSSAEQQEVRSLRTFSPEPVSSAAVRDAMQQMIST